MVEFKVKTKQHAELVLLTSAIQQHVKSQKWENGILTVFVPHTTAGVTIQENADPDVVQDLLYALEKAVPWEDSNYQHTEGNTAAHVKASLLGSSVQVIVEKGQLQLGTWQGIFFGEFDGPRERSVWLSFSHNK